MIICTESRAIKIYATKNSGNEIVLRVAMEMARSNKLLRYRAAIIPSKMATGTAIAAAEMARNNVLAKRQPTRSATGRPLARELPRSPFIKSPSQAI